MADCTRIIEMPMMDRVPWTKKAVTNPAIFAKPAIRPDVGTVFAISTPFGPGDITSNDATTIKAAMSVVAISGSAHGDFSGNHRDGICGVSSRLVRADRHGWKKVLV